MTLATPALTPNPEIRMGLVFMLTAGALVAATSLLAKTLGQTTGAITGLHPFMVSAGRFFFAFVTLLLFLAVRADQRPTMTHVPWSLHLLRSIFGWLGVTCMFAAVARMPVADATALSFLNPIVTVVFAVILLGESLTARKIVAVALALAGALLILRPGTEALQPAAFYALGAALLLGLEAVVIKKLSGTEPALRILLINNAIGATVSGLVAFLFWQTPVPTQWVMLAALGAVMVTAQSCFIQAMKRAEASAVIPALYSVLVFAALYDWGLYGVVPAFLTVVGSVFVIAAALLVSRRT